MLLDAASSETCVVKELKSAPLPATSARPELRTTDEGVLLSYHTAPVGPVHDKIVEVLFCRPRAFTLGSPNAEALSGHRLWGKGLEHWGFQEVTGSDWIADLERRNRVHHNHCPELFSDLRHFIISFEDVTFECVAEEFVVSIREQRTAKPTRASK